MASPKEAHMPIEVHTGDPNQEIKAGNAPQSQDPPSDGTALQLKLTEASLAAQNVPLPGEHQKKSEVLDPYADNPLEGTELGAEVLDEALVTQDPLEAEVKMPFSILKEPPTLTLS